MHNAVGHLLQLGCLLRVGLAPVQPRVDLLAETEGLAGELEGAEFEEEGRFIQ